MTNKFVLAVWMACIVALAATPADADKKWSYQIEPYFLGANIEGDAGIGRATGVDVDVDTSRILETLQLAAMLRFEAQHESGWGVALDYGFMDLQDDITGSRGGLVDAEVFQGILEVVAVKSGESGLDYYAGLRWWDNEMDVTVDPAVLPGTLTRSIDEDWIDLIAGVRWATPIGEKWSFLLQGDIGGLGSDFTYAGLAGFRFRMSKSSSLDLQYKALAVDYESGNPGEPGYYMYDTVTHGPIIGFRFGF